MPPIIPKASLARMAYPCLPFRLGKGATVVPELGDDHRLSTLSGMGQPGHPVDARLGWCDRGLLVTVSLTGKTVPCRGDVANPWLSDGVTLWLATRPLAGSKRANAFCHLFHLLPVGGGEERLDPVHIQSPVPRALEDAPKAPTGSVLFRSRMTTGGFEMGALFTPAALHGYDPEENSRLAFLLRVHDLERGAWMSGADEELPYAEDPQWWDFIDLVRKAPK